VNPSVRVVAALICRDREILVQQRKPGGPRGLLWEFPGGKVEPGESDADALVRECKEELDVVVAVAGSVVTSRHAYPDLTVELALYECTILEGEPRKLSAHELRWVAVDKLGGLQFLPADVPLLAAVINRFQGYGPDPA
jgi:8-oxo-dGTP diphosphatase